MDQTRTSRPDRHLTERPPDLVGRHPLLSFSIIAIAATWTVQLAFLALELPLFPALVVELVILVATASLVTRHLTGRRGFRQVFTGALRWRFGLGWYALVLLAMPAATLLVAGFTGTLDVTARQVPEALLAYLFLTVVYGALLGNIWEETAWTGFLQQRLMDRHGLLVGSLITAVPFALIHVPLVLEADGLVGTSAADVLLGVLVLGVAAPFLRYLIGLVFLRTGRSLLAVALLHGSFNACASTALVHGGWQYVVAVALLAPLVGLAVRGRTGNPA